MIKKIFLFSFQVLAFSVLMTLGVPIGMLVPWVLFFPPLLMYAMMFAIIYCFIPIFTFALLTKLMSPKIDAVKKVNFSAAVALLTCLFVAVYFGISDRGSSELMGPNGLTYFFLAQGSIVGFFVWRKLARIFLS